VPITDNMALRNFQNLFGCYVKRLEHLMTQIETEPDPAGGPLGPKQLEIFERMFVFCGVWSMGASGSEEARKIFDFRVRAVENKIMPSNQTVFE
jgi:hypothetical protein